MKSVAQRVKADPRITRRRAAVERARLRRFRWRALAVVGAVFFVWLALWSPVFKFRGVEVAGGHHVTETQIAKVAGLGREDNLLMLSQDRIQSAVESLPWVKSAKVQRRLPGTIRVVITERSPALILSAPEGDWTIDPQGRVLTEGAPYAGLPTIETGTPMGVEPGDHINTPQVRAAVKAVGSMPAELRKKVKAVFATSPERITFSLHEGPDVRYGGADRVHDKNAVLTAVLDRLALSGKQPAYVDVRVPESPAVGN